MLLRHLADCHFRERLCEGVQTNDVYKCPQCAHESKDKGGFVRHYGLVHKMVQKWLKEMGIHGYDDESRKAQLDAKRQAAQAAQLGNQNSCGSYEGQKTNARLYLFVCNNNMLLKEPNYTVQLVLYKQI